MIRKLKEKCIPFFNTFIVALITLFCSLIFTLAVSFFTEDNVSIENILQTASTNIFSIEPLEIQLFFLISVCIFFILILETKIESYIMTAGAATLATLVIFTAGQLALFIFAGLLLIIKLSTESPIYAAIILSALIVTLQGLKQLKAIPKDDKPEEEMKQATHRAAMLGVTPSLIKRIEAMEPKKENSHE